MNIRFKHPEPLLIWLKIFLAFSVPLVLLFILKPQFSPNTTSMTVILIIFFLVGLYSTNYVYVEISSTGITAKPLFGFGKFFVNWNELLHRKDFITRTGMRGVIFTVNGTTKKFFIPNTILDLPKFRNAIEQFSPKSHALRDLK